MFSVSSRKLRRRGSCGTCFDRLVSSIVILKSMSRVGFWKRLANFSKSIISFLFVSEYESRNWIFGVVNCFWLFMVWGVGRDGRGRLEGRSGSLDVVFNIIMDFL